MTQSFSRPVGLSGLFDLSFTRFITIGFIRSIYILGMVMIALSWAGFNLTVLVGAFNSRNTFQGLLLFVFMLLLSTIFAVLYLVMFRVGLEVIVVIFRIGDNTSAIAAAQGATPPTGGFPVMPMGQHP